MIKPPTLTGNKTEGWLEVYLQPCSSYKHRTRVVKGERQHLMSKQLKEWNNWTGPCLPHCFLLL